MAIATSRLGPPETAAVTLANMETVRAVMDWATALAGSKRA
jgi:hypothetical protein